MKQINEFFGFVCQCIGGFVVGKWIGTLISHI